MSLLRDTTRSMIALLVGGLGAVAGFALFVFYPDGDLAVLLGVVLAVLVTVGGLRLGSNIAASALPDYTVAEVAVEGPITRDGGGGLLPSTPNAATADEVVDQIERADEDEEVEALLVKLNTPGGEVVPSDDIRQAAVDFDGPTIGYTNDLCASGGMWIASGCDELWARDASLVGSIGVRFSQTRFDEFADDYGINYERIVSGDYKDALGAPFKQLEEDERQYLQGLSDDWYDNFVERVAEGRDMDETAVRDTEARVFLGEDAVEMGMVDELGDRDAVEDRLEDLIESDVEVEVFEPERGLTDKLGMGAATVAYAFGAGIASVVTEDGSGFELR